MLSQRTLRMMLVLSNRKKIQAERAAADASRRLSALGGQAATLSAYMAELGAQLTNENIRTGYDLRSYGRFIEMSIRARSQNEAAIAAGEADQKAALDNLAVETEKQKAIRKTMDQIASAADIIAAAGEDQSLGGRPAVSRESGKRGRTGFAPREDRQASSRQI